MKPTPVFDLAINHIRDQFEVAFIVALSRSFREVSLCVLLYDQFMNSIVFVRTPLFVCYRYLCLTATLNPGCGGFICTSAFNRCRIESSLLL
jgi:hypothetical protein